jgi:hypothetical protein
LEHTPEYLRQLLQSPAVRFHKDKVYEDWDERVPDDVEKVELPLYTLDG